MYVVVRVEDHFVVVREKKKKRRFPSSVRDELLLNKWGVNEKRLVFFIFEFFFLKCLGYLNPN